MFSPVHPGINHMLQKANMSDAEGEIFNDSGHYPIITSECLKRGTRMNRPIPFPSETNCDDAN